jgi:hypothetical protein
MPRAPRPTPLVLAALLALPAAAAAAPSGSVVFVREGDVWRIDAAGTREQAITRDGGPTRPYRSPSQARNGVVVALRGAALHRWALNGAPLPVPALPTASVPVAADVAPDGSLVAVVLPAPCADGVPGDCRSVVTSPLPGSGVWTTVVPAGPDVAAITFASPGRLLVARGNAVVAVSPTVAGASATTVVADDGSGAAITGVTAGPRGIAVARRPAVGEPGLRTFRPARSDAPATLTCDFTGTGVAAPTWAPRGHDVAWEVQGSIVAATFPAGGCPAQARMLVAEGGQPDWGPSGLAKRMVTGASQTGAGTVTGAPASARTVASEIAALTAGPGLRLSMRLNVAGRVAMVLDRRVGARHRAIRSLTTSRRRPGRVVLNLGMLAPGTYRVRVRVLLPGRSIALPPLRLVVNRG